MYASGDFKKNLFTDEKIFNVEEYFNKQNDRVYAKSSPEARQKVPRVQKGHFPASVMVWWGISYDSTNSIRFLKKA